MFSPRRFIPTVHHHSTSEQLQLSKPDPAKAGQIWQQQLNAALTAWGRLDADELSRTGGNVQKLTELIQLRYNITRAEADKQVKKFFSGRPH